YRRWDITGGTSRRLVHAVGAHRFPNGGPLRDSLEIAPQIRVGREIDAGEARPADDGKAVRVRDRESAAREVRRRREPLLDERETSREPLLRVRLRRLPDLGMEQPRAERLVQLGRDEVEPLLETQPLAGSRDRKSVV